MSQQCIDPIVGKILAGWRYDISGLAPEMSGDYEGHFAECECCSTRQKIQRDVNRLFRANFENWTGPVRT